MRAGSVDLIFSYANKLNGLDYGFLSYLLDFSGMIEARKAGGEIVNWKGREACVAGVVVVTDVVIADVVIGIVGVEN